MHMGFRKPNLPKPVGSYNAPVEGTQLYGHRILGQKWGSQQQNCGMSVAEAMCSFFWRIYLPWPEDRNEPKLVCPTPSSSQATYQFLTNTCAHTNTHTHTHTHTHTLSLSIYIYIHTLHRYTYTYIHGSVYAIMKKKTYTELYIHIYIYM